MPFETFASVPKKIAVVGAGISGLGAALALAKSHQVVLFESAPRLGGHARPVVAGRRGDQPVDTGFIVFNHANYPNLLKLFDYLGVPITQSNMSFGASIDGGRIEYGLASADALFAQRRNAVRPEFLGMFRDIMRFNARAVEMSQDPTITVGDLLDRLGTGRAFREHYLMPFSGAIWSTPTQKLLDFPARSMVQFFENHALLGVNGQHQWYTVKGGSSAYLGPLEAELKARGVDIRTSAAVKAVRRVPFGAEVRASGGDWEGFDEVVFATHGDDTLRMLSDASANERVILSAVNYQPNKVVLHSDPAAMPKNRKVWSSWNYVEPKGGRSGPISLSYWMNSLQPWLQSEDLFVTMNGSTPIREELIWDEVEFAHPVYDRQMMAAQTAAAAMNGANNTWFCGAWMKYGFHEDGLASGLDVARGINAAPALAMAAE